MIKVKIQTVNKRHGTFKKTILIHVNKDPKCFQCNEFLHNKDIIYWCRQNPKQFWHPECIDFTEHPKNYDGLIHEDIFGILVVDLK